MFLNFIHKYIYWSWIWNIPWGNFFYDLFNKIYNHKNSQKEICVPIFNGAKMYMNDLLHAQELELKKYWIFEKDLTKKILEIVDFNNIEEFIDIWANIWYYSVVVGTQFKNIHIVSIEPEYHNFNLLEKNITCNDIDNIELYNMGLWSTTKEEIIYYYPEVPWCTSIVNKKNHKNVHEEVIKINTFDNIITKTKNIFIKIDVEWYEDEVFKGAQSFLSKCNNTYIICELLKKTSSKESITDLLTKNKFKEVWSDSLDNYLFYKW